MSECKMNFDDKCDRFAIEYGEVNKIKNIRGFDDLSEYHQAKVAVIIKKQIGIPTVKGLK